MEIQNAKIKSVTFDDEKTKITLECSTIPTRVLKLAELQVNEEALDVTMVAQLNLTASQRTEKPPPAPPCKCGHIADVHRTAGVPDGGRCRADAAVGQGACPCPAYEGDRDFDELEDTDCADCSHPREVHDPTETGRGACTVQERDEEDTDDPGALVACECKLYVAPILEGADADAGDVVDADFDGVELTAEDLDVCDVCRHLSASHPDGAACNVADESTGATCNCPKFVAKVPEMKTGLELAAELEADKAGERQQQ